VIAGGIAPLLGVWFLSMTDYSWWPLGLYTFALGTITVFTTFITPETRARDLTQIHDAPLIAEAGHTAGRKAGHPAKAVA
jgi:MFS transporter, MHS family, metabolite:H+ symporter